MVDLEDAAQRLVATCSAGPITPISDLRSRARRRRRRRRGMTGLAACAVAVAVAMATVHLVPAGQRRLYVAAGGANQAVSLPQSNHPSGWRRVDIGRASLWLPKSWSYCTAGNNAQGISMVPLASNGSGFCPPPPFAKPPVAVLPPVSTSGWARASLNGIPAWERPVRNASSGSRTYDLPSLGVRLVAVGPVATRVVRTIEPSPLSALLATSYPVPVPSGWKTVRLGPVAASIPASWPVRRLTAPPREIPGNRYSACNLFLSSAAYLGKVRSRCSGIATGEPSPTGIWLGTSAVVPLVHARSTSVTLKTGNAVVDLRYGYTSSSYLVDFTIHTAAGTVQATLGLGSHPAIAEEILSSLRPAR
ncbi:MAG: hypothetical protein ACYDH5_14220 [Acidimicrobiales bacterium]